jgi:hypothetical protein
MLETGVGGFEVTLRLTITRRQQLELIETSESDQVYGS